MAPAEPPGVVWDAGDLPGYAPLDRAIDRALAAWRAPGPPLALLFSGGVDSGLLAWELRARAGLTLFTVGLASAPDLVAAESSARLLGLPWTGCAVTPAELALTADGLTEELEGRPPALRGLHVALAVAIERAPPGTILCGQGIDELFLGYAHFRGISTEAARVRSAEDLRRLQAEDWPATRRLAERRGRQIEAPFLDPGFVAAALEVPLERRGEGPIAKRFWRGWAAHRGLPPELAARPKRAMQYGSGIDRWYRARINRG